MGVTHFPYFFGLGIGYLPDTQSVFLWVLGIGYWVALHAQELVILGISRQMCYLPPKFDPSLTQNNPFEGQS